MLVVVVLLATVLLRVAIVTAVVYLLLPQGALCPHCNVEMVAVRNRVLDRAAGGPPPRPAPEVRHHAVAPDERVSLARRREARAHDVAALVHGDHHCAATTQRP